MAKKLGVEGIIRENGYADKIRRIYEEATREAALIGGSLSGVNPAVPFTFAQYPATTKRINDLLQSVASQTMVVINSGTKAEWLEANRSNDELVKRFLGSQKLSKVRLDKFYQRNMEALDAFQIRKDKGIDLSKRIWNSTNQFKQEIEMGLDLGLGEGKPAAEIARDLRQYLNDPDKLFRRVRDKHGNLQLSKNAKAYHPAAGAYRSSVRNAQRLARTEVNMAYRTSDYLRWKQIDFIIGIQILLSNNHPVTDVCFITWNYKVHTSKGLIAIAKIEVGDLVLTHTGKFRRVNEVFKTPSESVDMVEIGIEWQYDKRSSRKKISSTLNHPFNVNGKWTEAEKINVGDKVLMLASRCICCGEKIPYYRDFCSKSCSSKTVATNQHKRPEHNKSLSDKRRKLIAENGGSMPWFADYIKSGKNTNNLTNPESRAKATRNAIAVSKLKTEKGEHPFQQPENRKKAFAAIGAKKKNSFIERKIGWLLGQKGIEYINNFPFERELQFEKGTRRLYFIDYVLKEHKIAIEVDGEYWHKNKIADDLRQAEIESKGYTFLRFSGDQVRNRMQECSAEIDRILKNHNGEYEFIEVEVKSKRNWSIDNNKRKALTKYNLSVDIDNSYIVNGFVVHNCNDLIGKYPKDFQFSGFHPQCRCMAVPIMANEEEFMRYNQAVANGENRNSSFTGEVNELPKGFDNWVTKNADRIKEAPNLPYFLSDNEEIINKMKR